MAPEQQNSKADFRYTSSNTQRTLRSTSLHKNQQPRQQQQEQQQHRHQQQQRRHQEQQHRHQQQQPHLSEQQQQQDFLRPMRQPDKRRSDTRGTCSSDVRSSSTAAAILTSTSAFTDSSRYLPSSEPALQPQQLHLRVRPCNSNNSSSNKDLSSAADFHGRYIAAQKVFKLRQQQQQLGQQHQDNHPQQHQHHQQRLHQHHQQQLHQHHQQQLHQHHQQQHEEQEPQQPVQLQASRDSSLSQASPGQAVARPVSTPAAPPSPQAVTADVAFTRAVAAAFSAKQTLPTATLATTTSAAAIASGSAATPTVIAATASTAAAAAAPSLIAPTAPGSAAAAPLLLSAPVSKTMAATPLLIGNAFISAAVWRQQENRTGKRRVLSAHGVSNSTFRSAQYKQQQQQQIKEGVTFLSRVQAWFTGGGSGSRSAATVTEKSAADVSPPGCTYSCITSGFSRNTASTHTSDSRAVSSCAVAAAKNQEYMDALFSPLKAKEAETANPGGRLSSLPPGFTYQSDMHSFPQRSPTTKIIPSHCTASASVLTSYPFSGGATVSADVMPSPTLLQAGSVQQHQPQMSSNQRGATLLQQQALTQQQVKALLQRQQQQQVPTQHQAAAVLQQQQQQTLSKQQVITGLPEQQQHSISQQLATTPQQEVREGGYEKQREGEEQSKLLQQFLQQQEERYMTMQQASSLKKQVQHARQEHMHAATTVISSSHPSGGTVNIATNHCPVSASNKATGPAPAAATALVGGVARAKQCTGYLQETVKTGAAAETLRFIASGSAAEGIAGGITVADKEAGDVSCEKAPSISSIATDAAYREKEQKLPIHSLLQTGGNVRGEDSSDDGKKRLRSDMRPFKLNSSSEGSNSSSDRARSINGGARCSSGRSNSCNDRRYSFSDRSNTSERIGNGMSCGSKEQQENREMFEKAARDTDLAEEGLVGATQKKYVAGAGMTRKHKHQGPKSERTKGQPQEKDMVCQVQLQKQQQKQQCKDNKNKGYITRKQQIPAQQNEVLVQHLGMPVQQQKMPEQQREMLVQQQDEGRAAEQHQQYLFTQQQSKKEEGGEKRNKSDKDDAVSNRQGVQNSSGTGNEKRIKQDQQRVPQQQPAPSQQVAEEEKERQQHEIRDKAQQQRQREENEPQKEEKKKNQSQQAAKKRQQPRLRVYEKGHQQQKEQQHRGAQEKEKQQGHQQKVKKQQKHESVNIWHHRAEEGEKMETAAIAEVAREKAETLERSETFSEGNSTMAAAAAGEEDLEHLEQITAAEKPEKIEDAMKGSRAEMQSTHTEVTKTDTGGEEFSNEPACRSAGREETETPGKPRQQEAGREETDRATKTETGPLRRQAKGDEKGGEATTTKSRIDTAAASGRKETPTPKEEIAGEKAGKEGGTTAFSVSDAPEDTESAEEGEECVLLPFGRAYPEGVLKCCKKVYELDEGTREEKDRIVQVLLIHESPDLYLLPYLLTAAQCRHIIDLCVGRWRRSRTSKGPADASPNAYVSTESTTRTSHSARLRPAETPLVAAVEEIAAAFAGFSVDYLEPLAVVKYEEGQVFKEHHDGAFRPVTLLIYLNVRQSADAFRRHVHTFNYNRLHCVLVLVLPELFMLDLALLLHDAVASSSADMSSSSSSSSKLSRIDPRVLHAGLAPRKGGPKYVVNCFFNEKPIRQLLTLAQSTATCEVETAPACQAEAAAKSEAKVAPAYEARAPTAYQADETTALDMARDCQAGAAVGQKVVPQCKKAEKAGAIAELPQALLSSLKGEHAAITTTGERRGASLRDCKSLETATISTITCTPPASRQLSATIPRQQQLRETGCRVPPLSGHPSLQPLSSSVLQQRQQKERELSQKNSSSSQSFCSGTVKVARNAISADPGHRVGQQQQQYSTITQAVNRGWNALVARSPSVGIASYSVADAGNVSLPRATATPRSLNVLGLQQSQRPQRLCAQPHPVAASSSYVPRVASNKAGSSNRIVSSSSHSSLSTSSSEIINSVPLSAHMAMNNSRYLLCGKQGGSRTHVYSTSAVSAGRIAHAELKRALSVSSKTSRHTTNKTPASSTNTNIQSTKMKQTLTNTPAYGSVRLSSNSTRLLRQGLPAGKDAIAPATVSRDNGGTGSEGLSAFTTAAMPALASQLQRTTAATSAVGKGLQSSTLFSAEGSMPAARVATQHVAHDGKLIASHRSTGGSAIAAYPAVAGLSRGGTDDITSLGRSAPESLQGSFNPFNVQGPNNFFSSAPAFMMVFGPDGVPQMKPLTHQQIEEGVGKHLIYEAMKGLKY